jgi:hypothetical protein
MLVCQYKVFLLSFGLIRHKRVSGFSSSVAEGWRVLPPGGSVLPAGCSIPVRRLRRKLFSTFSFELYFRLVVFRPELLVAPWLNRANGSSTGADLSFSGLIWQGLKMGSKVKSPAALAACDRTLVTGFWILGSHGWIIDHVLKMIARMPTSQQ